MQTIARMEMKLEECGLAALSADRARGVRVSRHQSRDGRWMVTAQAKAVKTRGAPQFNDSRSALEP